MLNYLVLNLAIQIVMTFFEVARDQSHRSTTFHKSQLLLRYIACEIASS